MNEEELNYAEESMKWYGWRSPIGLGIFLISLALSCVIFKIALFAW
jgi:hypothetical protein